MALAVLAARWLLPPDRHPCGEACRAGRRRRDRLRRLHTALPPGEGIGADRRGSKGADDRQDRGDACPSPGRSSPAGYYIRAPIRGRKPDAFGSCRACGAPLEHVFVDLGMSPLCESYLAAGPAQPHGAVLPAPRLRLRTSASWCSSRSTSRRQSIFSEYAYFSSYSDSWLEHAEDYADDDRRAVRPRPATARWSSSRATTATCSSTSSSKGIPVLGIEPAANVAKAAVREGRSDARRSSSAGGPRASSPPRAGSADLSSATTCWPRCRTSTTSSAGMKILLKPRRRHHDGVPASDAADRGEPVRHDLPRALLVLLLHRRRSEIFAAHGLTTLRRRGACRRTAARCGSTPATPDDGRTPVGERVGELLAARGGRRASTGSRLLRVVRRAGQGDQAQAARVPDRGQARGQVRSPATARPGKGNTLLNYCGIRTDFLDYTVDRNPYKQGRFLPGTHIPIFPPEKIAETRPDYVLILPWNLKDEIVEQLAYIRDWGGTIRRADPARSRCLR